MKIIPVSVLVAVYADPTAYGLIANDPTAVNMAQCGANLPTKIKEECQVSLITFVLNVTDWFQDKAALKGEKWEPPFCDSETACRAAEEDPCSYSCIDRNNCHDCLQEYKIDDKLYCDCSRKCDPPRFGMYWSCDNTGHGFLFHLLSHTIDTQFHHVYILI